MMDYLFFYLGLFIVAIVFHELGHYLFAKNSLKRHAVIVFNGRIQTIVKPAVMDLKEYKELCKAGVIFGLIPLVLSLMAFGDYWVICLLVFPVYAVGCRADIKAIQDKR